MVQSMPLPPPPPAALTRAAAEREAVWLVVLPLGLLQAPAPPPGPPLPWRIWSSWASVLLVAEPETCAPPPPSPWHPGSTQAFSVPAFPPQPPGSLIVQTLSSVSTLLLVYLQSQDVALIGAKAGRCSACF